MLPKNNRAGKKEVERIFKHGKFINSPTLSFKFVINKESSQKKVSFIVPKSVAKLAVERNALRRLGYNALRDQLKYFPAGISGVFVFKKFTKDILLITNEVKSILNKIN